MLSVDDVIDLLAVELVGVIPEDESVIQSTNRGITVVLNSKSKAGQAYTNIASRLNGNQVEFDELDEQAGFFHRLTRLIGGEEA